MALVHGDPPGLTEIGNLHVTQLDLEAFGSGFSTGEKADVMQHTFALIAEARRPNGGNLQMATQLFHNESGKRLSGDVLCDYQHRPSTFCNLLQQREQTFPGTDCSFVDEDVNVVEGNFHAFGISNKVRREISAIELHAANLWSVAGDARNEAAVADNSSFFHMSQNAAAYCSKLCRHISRTSIARLKFLGLLSPSYGLCMMGNPVDGGLWKGTRENRPLLRSRFAQSLRRYCAEGITSKVARASEAH